MTWDLLDPSGVPFWWLVVVIANLIVIGTIELIEWRRAKRYGWAQEENEALKRLWVKWTGWHSRTPPR